MDMFPPFIFLMAFRLFLAVPFDVLGLFQTWRWQRLSTEFFYLWQIETCVFYQARNLFIEDLPADLAVAFYEQIQNILRPLEPGAQDHKWKYLNYLYSYQPLGTLVCS